MTPARTGHEELVVEQVERLGARRLAEIVVNHCHRDEGLRQTVRIASAASAPSDTLGRIALFPPRANNPPGWEL